MTIVRAADLPQIVEQPFEVCIVGGGAMGLALARLLEGSGRRVLVLESGFDDHDADQQALGEVLTGGLPLRTDVTSHPRRLGGATNEWGGRCIEHVSIDLEPRSWVAHSGWPLSIASLEEHYPVIEDLIGLQDAPPLGPEAAVFRAGGAFDVETFRWAETVEFGPRWRDLLDRSTTVAVALGATVVGLRFDDARVDGVEVATVDGQRFAVGARTVVLAAAGMENVRLLAFEQQRRGGDLGGPQLGRRVMEHPKTREGGWIVPTDRYPDAWLTKQTVEGMEIHRFVRISDDAQRRNELLNHAVYLDDPVRSDFNTAGYQAQRALRHSKVGSAEWRRAALGTVRNAGSIARYALRKRRGELGPIDHILMVNQLDQPPDNGSTISLGDTVDRHGVPLPVFDWRIGDQELDSLRWLHERLDAQFRAQGWGHVESPFLTGEGDEVTWLNASHPMGGTRMATSPADGVVNADLLVHGTTNLYVTGVSALPTAGYANPTFTALALTSRLAAHLIDGMSG